MDSLFLFYLTLLYIYMICLIIYILIILWGVKITKKKRIIKNESGNIALGIGLTVFLSLIGIIILYLLPKCENTELSK